MSAKRAISQMINPVNTALKTRFIVILWALYLFISAYMYNEKTITKAKDKKNKHNWYSKKILILHFSFELHLCRFIIIFYQCSWGIFFIFTPYLFKRLDIIRKMFAFTKSIYLLCAIQMFCRYSLVFCACFFVVPLTVQGKSPDTTTQQEHNKQELFVITNRSVDSTKHPIPFLCTVREDKKLSFLCVNSATDDSLKATKLDSVVFFRELTKIPTDWVVFVHGDSKTFEKAVQRAIKMQELYQLRVILFSWSSRDPSLGGGENFRRSHYNVRASMQHFN